jgi:hypothetical protein
MKPGRVRVHIDRLVLRGIPREQRDAFVAAFEKELSRQFAQAQPLGALGARLAPTLEAGRLQLPGSSGPKQLGLQAARALALGLKG